MNRNAHSAPQTNDAIKLKYTHMYMFLASMPTQNNKKMSKYYIENSQVHSMDKNNA